MLPKDILKYRKKGNRADHWLKHKDEPVQDYGIVWRGSLGEAAMWSNAVLPAQQLQMQQASIGNAMQLAFRANALSRAFGIASSA